MSQSLAEVKYRLAVALQEQKKLTNEIDELRQYIGLFQEKLDLNKRNADIYCRFKNGVSITDIAGQYGLSKSTVKYICDRARFQERKNSKK